VRAVGYNLLAKGDGHNLVLYFLVGDDQQAKLLQTGRRGCQPNGFHNLVDIHLGNFLGGVVFFGGVAPLQMI